MSDMPVTVNLNDHQAAAWTAENVTTSEKLLELACPREYKRSQRIVQSSFRRSALEASHVSPSNNGFVWAAYHAYSTHHHLVIRPEDVWFAILTQTSFFINANAEDLRTFFVQHEGQMDLEVISDYRDFGALALQMTKLIAKNVIDPELRDWVMPSFSTTTLQDKVVGAVLFMGAMQKYFSYQFTIRCGLPSVTLLGEVGDWREILKRIDKLDLLGEEPKLFASMLRPIVQHIILSFEDPTSPEVKDFWNVIVHRNRVGSGTDYLSGWLTAFCFWSEEGKALRCSARNIQFGDVQYPTVPVSTIPSGVATVPVKVDDNGYEYEATMIAGSVGIAASYQNATSANPLQSDEDQVSLGTTTAEDRPSERIRDTVQPVSGWWICENESSEEAAKREAEKKRLREELEEDSKKLTGPYSESQHWEDYIVKSNRLRELESY